MNETQTKQAIQSTLQSFAHGNPSAKSIALFALLGYDTSLQNPLDQKTYAAFKDAYLLDCSAFNEAKAQVKDWKSVDLLFQLTGSQLPIEVSDAKQTSVDQTIIESYLFFALELIRPEYTRSELSQITREINRVFAMPAMILFRYGNCLTLAIIHRRLNKKDCQKDVLEKVTLIKDISLANPYRAHLEILFDLSLAELKRVHKFTNFVELHHAWQQTLDTKELNKRFYKELSHWYFWAMGEVVFPSADDESYINSIHKKEERVQEHHAKSLIRLLTRLLFVWFVKEKNLIPEELFDERFIKEHLIDGFEPKKKRNFDHKSQGSKYYRAILQNLFFATLNQTVGKRQFRKPDQHMNVTNLMRYQDYFINPQVFIDLVEKTVPFMNGGLFECLDSPDPVHKGKKGGDIINYEDGFSDRDSNILCVPDYIFFGVEEHADLSEALGDKKQKDVTVSGLIDILKRYKFTIMENTPVEEDIALDPELLGRVFENLLASFNPETKTTARKQTGSFYTPREIVNYMVDEALKVYLKRQLEDEAGITTKVAESGLDILLGYNETAHPFAAKQTAILINAIDTCKILDLACGSGAFPMGMLHKLVHILHKLDPQNKLWKEKQLEKASAIDDPTLRDSLMEDIETAFTNNELDYGRKLYLIENGIYGVDIQPIATQISKLRFFISLIVDQKPDKIRPNFGIRPLPNLETKFVAADTLLGMEKQDEQLSILDNPEVKELERKLKEIRHRLFSAKTPATKRKLREEDQNLRAAMGKILVDDGWSNESARLLADWDPYDQNASSPWFDPEWMFGITGMAQGNPNAATGGFDIVIGNPPYVQIQNFSGRQQQKDWERQKFKTFAKTGDIYCLFYERGFQLLKPKGVLAYITSNKWMRANYGKALRKYFGSNGAILQLIDFGDSPIFENATTYTNILLWQKSKKQIPTKAWDLSKAYATDTTLYELLDQQGEYDPLFTEDSFVVIKGEQTAIKQRIEAIGVPLKEWDIAINYGIKTGLNEAFIITGQKKNELIAEDPKSAEILKPILRGRDIKRYQAEFADLWLIASHNGYKTKDGDYVEPIDLKKDYPAVFRHLESVGKAIEAGEVKTKGKGLFERDDQGAHWSNLRECAYFPEFEKEKLLYAEIVFDSAFYFDTEGFYPEATTFILTGDGLRFLAGMLNSRLLTYAFKKFYAGGDLQGNTFRYKKVFLELLPVPKLTPAS